MTIELVPLCTIDLVLADPVFVGDGPEGMRLVYPVVEGTLRGERLQARVLGSTNADWVRVHGTVGSVDVRITFQTDDGAVIHAEYGGRTDISGGPGTAPVYVAPRFEAGDQRYAWLNAVQAVGKGVLDGSNLTYEWYEVR